MSDVTNYVSCLKLNGVPILPPVLNDQKRDEMRYFKELAVKVEERLKKSSLKSSLSDSTTDDELSATYATTNSSYSEYLSDKSENDTYKSQMFSENSHRDILNMLKDNLDKRLNQTEKAIENVPLSVDPKLVPTFKELDLIRKTDSSDTEKSDNTEKKDSQKDSKVIRSNSFVLEKPSPVLLAHMQKQQESVKQKSPSHSPIRSHSQSPTHSSTHSRSHSRSHSPSRGPYNFNSVRKRRSWDLVTARKNWSSIENDIGICQTPQRYKQKNFNSNKNMSYSSSLPTSTNQSPDLKMFNSYEMRKNNNVKQSTPKTSCINKRTERLPPTRETEKRIRGIVTPVRGQRFIKQPEKDESLKKKSPTKGVLKSPVVQKNKISPKEKILKTDKEDIKTSPKLQKAHVTIISRKERVNDSISSDLQNQLREMFTNIQNEQTKKISELLLRQKEEQIHLLRSFAEQQTMLFSKLNEMFYSDKIRSNNEVLVQSNIVLTECKQILNESQMISDDKDNSSPNNSNDTNDTLADLTLRTDNNTPPSSPENQTVRCSTEPPRSRSAPIRCKTEPTRSKSESVRYSTESTRSGMEPTRSKTEPIKYNMEHHELEIETVKSDSKKRDNVQITSKSRNCSRSLFSGPKQFFGESKSSRNNGACVENYQILPSMIDAATKINAAVRGFLVRRLLKTERVQTLIQTIKDALICAMELHSENVENIQPADIELHRRLIQQVTSTCYSFHEVFFSLSTKDQMNIITLDRERQKEKAMRPVSARSTSSLSSTTQKVLERKMLRESVEEMSISSKSSFVRSCHSASDIRSRTRSLGAADSGMKTSQNCAMSKTVNYGANKKPWR